MILDDLIEQVKKELKQSRHYDMRTFDFIHFDPVEFQNQETVEFFVYEKPSFANRAYLCRAYDLMTGHLLYEWTISRHQEAPAEKRVLGFERQGVVTLFPA